jgi:hypothetical protein
MFSRRSRGSNWLPGKVINSFFYFFTFLLLSFQFMSDPDLMKSGSEIHSSFGSANTKSSSSCGSGSGSGGTDSIKSGSATRYELTCGYLAALTPLARPSSCSSWHVTRVISFRCIGLHTKPIIYTTSGFWTRCAHPFF